MQLCRLKPCVLLRGTRTKSSIGTYVIEYQELGFYKVISQELQDEVSASIYGANIDKTLRISSPRKKLEKLLGTKTNSQADNISNYAIEYEGKIYKIVSVKTNWIDMEATSEVKVAPHGSV